MSRLLPPPGNFLLAVTITVGVLGVAERLYDRRVAIRTVKDVGGTMGISYWKPDWLRKSLNDDDCFWDPVRITLPPSPNDKTDDENLASLADTLCSFDRLRTLDIRNEITDQSAKALGRLTRLTTLRLSNTAVSDETIRQLVKLKQLRSLTLSGTQITDDCIDDLSKLTSLTRLSLVDTQLSEDAILKLSLKLSKCKITF